VLADLLQRHGMHLPGRPSIQADVHLALRLSPHGVEDNSHGRNKLHGQGGGNMRRSAERVFAERRRATAKSIQPFAQAPPPTRFPLAHAP